VDDEVRDRATFYAAMVEDSKPALVSKYVVNPLPCSISQLERTLCEYTASSTEEPFDVKVVPIAAIEKPAAPTAEEEAMGLGGGPPAPAPAVTENEYRNQMAELDEFEDFGPLFKSSEVINLTESETEYKVTMVKHVFGANEDGTNHAVFQFNMTNTLNDQILENVRILLDEMDEEDCIFIPAQVMKYDSTVVAYTAIALDTLDTEQSYSCNMDFTVKDCDPDTGDVDDEGYPDTYALEEIVVSIADMMQPVDKPNFGAAWEELADSAAAEETYELSSMDGIEDAVTKITAHLGMKACEKSDKVKSGKNTHSLYLAGVYASGHDVLIRAKLAFDDGVTLQLSVRSSDEDVCQLVAGAVG